ncbi:MAG: ankyrin repeat domain-containing protein [bacterium]|nr:ankyrin repeat domain-containing protein [bacterium]
MSRKRTFVVGCLTGSLILFSIVCWQVLAYIARLWLWTASATCGLVMQHYALMLGVGVDTRTRSGETPLMMAARSGCAYLVADFIERGANVNATDNRGITPLFNAAVAGDVKSVRLLLRAGANPNIAMKHWQVTPLMRAAERGHIQVVRELLAAGADPMQRDWRGRTALDYAKKGTYPEHRIIERLLQQASRAL